VGFFVLSGMMGRFRYAQIFISSINCYKDQISMNWELQFLGKVNNQNLYKHLFEKGVFGDLVPEKTVKKFYNLFINNNPKVYAHPISMLLTLGKFQKNYNY